MMMMMMMVRIIIIIIGTVLALHHVGNSLRALRGELHAL
jgi:DMSO reductase anchor subunit